MRLLRARIPSHHADVFIDPAPSGKGVRLRVGEMVLNLKPDMAIALANEIADVLETQEHVNNIIKEGN